MTRVHVQQDSQISARLEGIPREIEQHGWLLRQMNVNQGQSKCQPEESLRGDFLYKFEYYVSQKFSEAKDQITLLVFSSRLCPFDLLQKSTSTTTQPSPQSLHPLALTEYPR